MENSNQNSSSSNLNRPILIVLIVMIAFFCLKAAYNSYQKNEFRDSLREEVYKEMHSEPVYDPEQDEIQRKADEANETFNLIKKAAIKYKSVCPVMVDEDTRLDFVKAIGSGTLQFNMTLINYAREDLDLPAFKNKVKELTIGSAKNDPSMQEARDRNVTFNYVYKDMNGYNLANFDVTPDDYNY